jgi:hypothetical protein
MNFNINSRVKKLEDEAHARKAMPAACTCIEQHIEVFGTVEFLDGVAHEHLELTPEQELIVESQRACLHDHSGEGVSMTIVPPLSDQMRLKLGSQVFPVNE